ncbi:hypothetical protein LJR296_001440 [Cupriavidus necator]|uniref:hypothetical protein n=1 Tax=Cupriavidus necator TaxID=106590 RepID=UPI003ECF4978
MRDSQTHIAAPPTGWIYDVPPNRGAKVQLLTVGGISTTGHWYGELGQYLLGWAPLLKRDKAREAEILARRG